MQIAINIIDNLDLHVSLFPEVYDGPQSNNPQDDFNYVNYSSHSIT